MSIFAMMSNFSIEEFKQDTSKKYENAIFANGIWQKRKEPVGTFTVQINNVDCKPLGLTKECAFAFEFGLPKIPISILNIIHKLYVDIYAKFKAEVYVSLYWDKKKEDYFLHIPKQQVSGASVKFENDATMLNNPDHFIVMDSHSHNVMGKCYS